MSVHHPIVESGTQALKTVSGLFWLGLSATHRAWRVRRRPEVPPAILVVGSLRAGGTAKTDLVAWIAARHPDLAILTHHTGDEDAWLLRQFPGRVFAHRDLLAACGLARKAGFSAALSDGGLQDPALGDCPAICLDLEDNPTVADLLPFGRYRELSPRPRPALLRLSLERDLVPTLDPSMLPPRGTRLVAACAIARPEAFFSELEAAGLALLQRLAFRDHRRFDPRRIRNALDRHPGIAWIVTEKDAARGELPGLPAGSFAIRRILSPRPGVSDSVDALVERIRSNL